MSTSDWHGGDQQPSSAPRSMTDPTPHPTLPTPAERDALNAALHATGDDTGFWDDQGRPAPWPEDIDQWTPYTNRTATHEPPEPPF
jgi:hypothetical protein